MAPIPKPKRARTKHYFKEWREKAGLTQEQAMGRLDWSQSKISRVESGKTPFNEDDLAAAAAAYGTTPTSLISVNPLVEGEVIDLMRLLQSAQPDQRKLALDLVQRVLTGT